MHASGRVLVVDDEPALRRLLTDLFSIEGYRVIAASDGAQALERLPDFRPDVVVLDMTMPVMNGWTFAEKCHDLAGYEELPIVAVTAQHDVDGAGERLARLGVTRCLAKPFDVAELLAVVGQLTKGAGMQRSKPQMGICRTCRSVRVLVGGVCRDCRETSPPSTIPRLPKAQ